MSKDAKHLEALYVAAEAIKKMEGITNVSVDNDADSGEIFFTTSEGEYALKLQETA